MSAPVLEVRIDSWWQWMMLVIILPLLMSVGDAAAEIFVGWFRKLRRKG